MMSAPPKTTTLTIEKVRGRDLPPEWARRAGIGDDDLVDVTLGPPREQRVKALLEFMDQAADEARRKGLDDERLAELLRDD